MGIKGMLRAALCSVGISLMLAPAAQGASDPLFVFTPFPTTDKTEPIKPPPNGRLNGPCGLGVDSLGRFYVSDYYHHAIDVFKPDVNVAKPWEAYVTQLPGVDPIDGPCGLALNSLDQLYVNNYHRNVAKFNASPLFGSGSILPLPEEDTPHHLPTGVAVDTLSNYVYVNHRTYVSVFDPSGNPVLDEGLPLKIGEDSLVDGYGIAVSRYLGTFGYLYVPDAGTGTVKVFNPAVDTEAPVAELKDPLGGLFVSLRDSAIAIDRVTGDVYFADNLQPEYTEQPQASIYVYSSSNVYKGRLKYNAVTGQPVGLAVDNSAQATQGRVYVSSGDSSNASVYVYGPGSATLATPLPPIGSGLPLPSSSNGGSGLRTDRMSSGDSFARGKQAPSASSSVVTQEDNLRVSVEGKLTPRTLPRKGKAPISVAVGWDISTVDGSPSPKLKNLRIEINKEGQFETEGLPTCPYAKIQPASTQRALSNCRSALVGKGSFEANIALKGQEGESYAAKGKLLVFNGEAKGKPVLFGQIYSAHPFATSFVITFDVRKIRKGDYGTELFAKLPPSLRSWGDLTGIQMTLHRNYRHNGRSHSYVSAGCPAPKGFGLASFKLARTSFAFNGGKKVSSVVNGECKPRESRGSRGTPKRPEQDSNLRPTP